VIWLGLVLAVASAVAINGGYVLQHQHASSLPPLTLRRPVHSLLLLFRSGRWLTGFLAGIGGWALYVAALALAPLSLVQACAAGGIGVLAIGIGKLARYEKIGVGSAFAGLALLGLSLGSHTDKGHAGWPAVAVWIAVSLVVAGLVAGPGSRQLASGAGLGIAAGVLYAAGDVGTKSAVGLGWSLLFVPVLLACHGLAFICMQFAFQRGGRLTTAGLAVLWTNALPIVAGTVVFAESLPAGWRGAARVAAFLLVLVGAVALSRQTADGAPVPLEATTVS
jgi:hypothetical protein